MQSCSFRPADVSSVGVPCIQQPILIFKNFCLKILKFHPCLFLALTSCVGTLSYPGKITYKVEVSDDVLELFKVEIQYVDNQSDVKNSTMRTSPWSVAFLKTGDPSCQLDVTLSAKDLSGSNLTRDIYTMALSSEIVFEDSPSISGSTKAAFTDSNGSNIEFSFSVPCSSSQEIKVAPLKYDKHFAFCFSVDDSYENGWSKVFALFNGKWIDDIEFFHKGLARTDGYQPESPLCITDGCGNDRRFTFGEAIWPNLSNKYNPNGFIQDVIISQYNPYISWEELQIMTDMGNAVYWHNVNTTEFDENVVENIVSGFEKDYDTTLKKIGFPLKVLAQPDGNQIYLDAALLSPLVHLSRATTRAEEVLLNECVSLYKKEIYGGNRNCGIAEKLQELSEQAAASEPRLSGYLVHRPTEDELDMFREIYALYGKAGADNIWVTSYDEFYEYKQRASSLKIKCSEKDGKAYYTVTVPFEENFLYEDLTFVVSGAAAAASAESDNLYGFSSALRQDGTVIVNCTFGDRNYLMAQKYVELYEDNIDSDDKEYALYLISLLREDLRGPLLQRVYNVHEPTREDMPLNGVYTKNKIRQYVRLYDGYTETKTW